MSIISGSYYDLDPAQMEMLKFRTLRFAREECPEGLCPIDSELIRCVNESVAIAAHDSRLSNFVPVLAMRRVQGCIAAGTCDRAQI